MKTVLSETRESAYDYMFRNLPGGYHRCAVDDEYTFLYVSDRFLNLLGWTKEELQTRFDNKFINLLHPEDRIVTDGYVDQILDDTLEKPYQEAMYRLQCKDGYRWFSDTTMLATIGDETFFQGFITDISAYITEKQQKYEIIASLGAAYEEVSQVDFNNECYQMLIGVNEGKTGSLDDFRKAICERNIKESDKERILELLDYSSVQAKLRDTNQISWDLKSESGGWYTVSAITQSRDHKGDVMQFLLVAQNITGQKMKELEYQESLEKKNRELEKLLRMEREYSAILPVLRSVYDQILTVDLETDTYHMIQTREGYGSFSDDMGNARQSFLEVAQTNITDSYSQMVYSFLDLDTVSDRLSETDSIFTEYMDKNRNWKSLSFLVQERDNEGKPAKLLFTIRNINKLKEAEFEQRRLTETRLQTMAEAIHGGFKLGKNDPDFTLIMVSEQLANLLGYDSPEEFIEASGGTMNGIADRAQARLELPHALKSVQAGEMYTMHYRVRCKDGSWKNIEDRGRLLVNENGEEEFWSFIVDQDEMVKTAEALEAAKKANRELDEARNKLKIASDKADAANRAKTQFLFNMSHDIRTPMNALLGYNQLIKKNLTDPVLLDYQNKMEQAGNILLDIINNVLDMARIESGKLELDENYINIRDEVGDIFNAFAKEAEKKNIDFTYNVDVTHENIICDDTKIKAVCLNLISNAIKYTPAGKTVTVTTRELPCEQEGYVLIQTEVKDTGIGMSEEFLPHIFDSFEREKNTTIGKIHGTGLGMSIVKRLVDFMDGTIDVKSELGKGSVISFTLKHKLVEKIDLKHVEDNLERKEIKSRIAGKHVILAEDNEMNAEIATIVLEDAGLIVDRVEDGVQCVAHIENNPAGTYDVILMDIQMPHMNGYKATHAIRSLEDKAKASIPIVAMTANAFEEDRQDAFNIGMNGHIAKPISIKMVEEVLASLLK